MFETLGPAVSGFLGHCWLDYMAFTGAKPSFDVLGGP